MDAGSFGWRRTAAFAIHGGVAGEDQQCEAPCALSRLLAVSAGLPPPLLLLHGSDDGGRGAEMDSSEYTQLLQRTAPAMDRQTDSSYTPVLLPLPPLLLLLLLGSTFI